MFNRIGIILVYLLVVRPVWAVSISFFGAPEVVNYDQELDLSVSLICPRCGDSYLRGVFAKSVDSYAYFGFTKNNSGEWIESENDRTKYFKVGKDELHEGSWSGKLKVKPDKRDLTTGIYIFKIGRYTKDYKSSADWSDSVDLRIIGPQPTVTNTPVPVMATSTVKLAIPSATTTKTPTVTIIPVRTVTLVNDESDQPANTSVTPDVAVTSKYATKEVDKSATKAAENSTIVNAQVLGENDMASGSAAEINLETNLGLKRILVVGLLSAGFLSGVGGAGMFWYKYNKKVNNL